MWTITLTRCGSGCSYSGTAKTLVSACLLAKKHAGVLRDNTRYIPNRVLLELFRSTKALIWHKTNVPFASTTNADRTFTLTITRS